MVKVREGKRRNCGLNVKGNEGKRRNSGEDGKGKGRKMDSKEDGKGKGGERKECMGWGGAGGLLFYSIDMAKRLIQQLSIYDPIFCLSS